MYENKYGMTEYFLFSLKLCSNISTNIEPKEIMVCNYKQTGIPSNDNLPIMVSNQEQYNQKLQHIVYKVKQQNQSQSSQLQSS